MVMVVLRAGWSWRNPGAALAIVSLLWAGACDGGRAERSAAAAHDERVREVAVPMQLYGVYDRDVAVGEDPSQLTIPPGILDSSWIRELRAQQLAAVAHLDVFHDFAFQDRLPESGISFQHRIVEDAGRIYKAVHYDHGNGLAVADVDGDGLTDIYFTTQLGGNQLWRNLGNGRFEDWTERSGVAVADRIGVSASFADTDNDGDADLYVTTVRGGNLLLENDGRGVFRDVSRRSGLDYVGHSSAAVFFDYDRDGRLDLFLANVGTYTTDRVGPGGYYVGHVDAFDNHLLPEDSERSILFRNLGRNRFADVSEQVGLVDTGWSGDAHPLDGNGDGWPDLYVLNMQGHDEYWESVAGERFIRRGRELFPRTPFGAMGIGVFDYDNDGAMDIFVTDMHTDMMDGEPFQEYVAELEKAKLRPEHRPPAGALGTDGNHVWGNALFHNDGSGSFSEVSDALNVENYWPWGLSIGDLNADGYEDLFIASSMNFPFRYAVNSLLLNDAGKRFVDSEFILGVEPRRDGRTAKPWFTLDCSGRDRLHQVCRTRDGEYTVWGALGSRSSAIFDLDADGDLDIVTNDFNSEPMVLVSDLAQRTAVRWLKVTLVGRASNRDGLGARVAVTTDGHTLTRYQSGKSGYLAQSRLPLYFGLGGSHEVRSIEVLWPSGRRQRIEGPIATNQHLVVTEPRGRSR